MGKLTALGLKRLTTPGRYGDGDGLWLQVRGPDQRSWLFRYASRGKQRQMGLGVLPTVSLAEARQAAQAAQRLLREGKDPIDARRAEVAKARVDGAVRTFGNVALLYMAAHEAGWRGRSYRKNWLWTLNAYMLPQLGDRPISEVCTADVMRVLEPIWREKLETSARVRRRIEAILDYAKTHSWREGENPARWRGHLANLLPARSKLGKVKHHAALPWAEIGAFMVTVRERTDPLACLLEFTILTATRTGEARNARWSEIDLGRKLWIIPAERMKADREHRVPLSAPSLAVLDRMLPLRAEQDGFVFPGSHRGKPFSFSAMLYLLETLGRSDLTVHGFRSTFRDWAAEATSHQREVAEAALAHSLGDNTEAAYQRGDLLAKRARLMKDWAAFCSKPAAVGDVVALRRA